MLALDGLRRKQRGSADLNQAERAVQLAENLNQEFGKIPRYQTALANALNLHASLIRENDPTRADEMHDRAADILRGLCGRFSEVPAYRSILASVLSEQSMTLEALERPDESLCVLEEAITKQSEFLDASPNSAFGRQAMAGHLRMLAQKMVGAGNEKEAQRLKDSASKYWKRRPSVEDTSK